MSCREKSYGIVVNVEQVEAEVEKFMSSLDIQKKLALRPALGEGFGF